MPSISAACHQVIFLAIACNITSCTFIAPLHRGPRVRVHACHALSSSPPAKRTSHVLSQPDISCATDTGGLSTLTGRCDADRFPRENPHIQRIQGPIPPAAAQDVSAPELI